MKKFFTYLLMISFLAILMHGQEIQVHTYYSKTVMGLQQGYGVRYMNSRAFGAGFVYQSTVKRDVAEGASFYPLWGLEFIVPIKHCEAFQFSLTPKIGYVSNQFLVIIPEAETSVRIKNWLSAGLIAGVRAREASSGLKLTIHLL